MAEPGDGLPAVAFIGAGSMGGASGSQLYYTSPTTGLAGSGPTTGTTTGRTR